MKLNQIIAIESGVKSKTTKFLSELYKAVQHPQLFDGFNKKYKPLDENGERFPPENKKVQITAQQVVKGLKDSLGELFDVTATKDYGNCEAFADVVVDGEKVLERVPVPYLLFLEKQLTDLHTLVEKMPVLDPAEEWSFDQNAGLFRTGETETVKTKKVQKSLVLLQPTDKHPGQAQLITEDMTVGYWETVKLSGAFQAPQKAALVAKIEKLQKAVKFAREEANGTPVDKKEFGAKVLNWIFG